VIIYRIICLVVRRYIYVLTIINGSYVNMLIHNNHIFTFEHFETF